MVGVEAGLLVGGCSWDLREGYLNLRAASDDEQAGLLDGSSSYELEVEIFLISDAGAVDFEEEVVGADAGAGAEGVRDDFGDEDAAEGALGEGGGVEDFEPDGLDDGLIGGEAATGRGSGGESEGVGLTNGGPEVDVLTTAPDADGDFLVDIGALDAADEGFGVVDAFSFEGGDDIVWFQSGLICGGAGGDIPDEDALAAVVEDAAEVLIEVTGLDAEEAVDGSPFLEDVVHGADDVV